MANNGETSIFIDLNEFVLNFFAEIQDTCGRYSLDLSKVKKSKIEFLIKQE